MASANETVKEVHDRMQIILSPDYYLDSYPASTKINSAKNDDVQLINNIK